MSSKKSKARKRRQQLVDALVACGLTDDEADVLAGKLKAELSCRGLWVGPVPKFRDTGCRFPRYLPKEFM